MTLALDLRASGLSVILLESGGFRREAADTASVRRPHDRDQHVEHALDARPRARWGHGALGGMVPPVDAARFRDSRLHTEQRLADSVCRSAAVVCARVRDARDRAVSVERRGPRQGDGNGGAADRRRDRSSVLPVQPADPLCPRVWRGAREGRERSRDRARQRRRHSARREPRTCRIAHVPHARKDRIPRARQPVRARARRDRKPPRASRGAIAAARGRREWPRRRRAVFHGAPSLLRVGRRRASAGTRSQVLHTDAVGSRSARMAPRCASWVHSAWRQTSHAARRLLNFSAAFHPIKEDARNGCPAIGKRAGAADARKRRATRPRSWRSAQSSRRSRKAA